MKSTIARTNEEEMLKTLSEQAPVGVCIIQDGKFCYVNSNFPIAIGYTVDELLGKDSLEIVAPEDREMVKENTIKMLKGELTSPYQFRVIHRDGSIVWVMATVKSIDYRGRRATLGNYMEITGRKQLEEALKEREERYRELANSITDVFFAMDDHLRYTYWNKASEILTGIPAEDALGKSLTEIFPDTPALRRAEKMYRKVLRTQQSQTFVNNFDIDGKHYVFEISAYPSRGGISVFVKDITENEQAEEALRQSEEKHRALFDSAVIGTIVIDAETTKVMMANQAAAEMLGLSYGEELIGVDALANIPLEEKESVRELMAKDLFEQDLRQTREFRMITKDGREIWISANAARIIHEGKLAALASFTDITERKQAVEALRQSEERYRTILEEMEDAYFEVDLGGHFTFVNNSVCRDLGYSKEELMGMSYKKFTIEEDIESVFRVFNEVYRTGVPNKGFPWRTVRKDGSHGFAETSVSLLRNDKGEIIGFRGVGRDITERKQTEEKLRRSRERYRALFDSSVIGTLVVDAETMKVVIGNQAAVKMFGFNSAEEGAGVNLLEFVPPEEKERTLELLKKELFEQNSRQAFDLQTLTKDGRKIWISAAGARITHGGRLAGLLSFVDITERKKMEEALNLQRAYFQQLFDNSPDAIVMLDINDRLVHANKGFEALFGYSAEEIQGRSIRELIIPEDDTQAISDTLQRVLSGEVVRRETLRRRKDGGLVDVSTLLYPIRHNDKVVGACFTYTDITERKKAEEKLRQSEENYKTLFNSAVIGMYVMDAETLKVVMGNRAAREMIGFSFAEEGIGVNPFDFVVPEDREKVLEIAINDFLQDSRGTHEIRVMDKNGRRGWQSISIAKIMHKGRLASLVSFMDITERKQAEEALRQSEENYRALFDSTVIGTIVLDAETMKVVMANQAAAKMLGLSSVEEGIGVNPLDFVHPDDRERVFKIIVKDMFEQDLRQTNELRAETKDGREIWISATGAKIMHEGRLAGLISFIDITEQKRQNERLIMTDRLASIGELAAGTAHELNNPLTSIIGFSQLLTEKDIPDDIRADLKLIYSEAQRAADVTKGLLTFARKQAPVKQPTQINNIIEDVLKLRAYEHKLNGIEVEKQLAPDLPKITVDYFQMQQLFINIIMNAEYSMTDAHKRGTLTIATRKQNSTVMISFTDDGPGIAPENLSRIFDPFFTTKEAGKGTGLGLSICHGIVAEHGGQIYARSQVGKGATIFIELPINHL